MMSSILSVPNQLVNLSLCMFRLSLALSLVRVQRPALAAGDRGLIEGFHTAVRTQVASEQDRTKFPRSDFMNMLQCDTCRLALP